MGVLKIDFIIDNNSVLEMSCVTTCICYIIEIHLKGNNTE
jgi:hypothetical protein